MKTKGHEGRRTNQKRGDWKIKFAIALVVVIVLVCCGSCAVGTITLLSPTHKATATVQAIAEATEAAKPTDTPVPTSMPTNTPKPTDTPKPAATSELPTNTPKPTTTNIATLGPPPTPIETAIPTPHGGGTGRIAFMSERDGNSEIYMMNADGSGAVRLTHNAATDWNPAWSPDGTRIAFASDLTGNFEIYVMNADGSGLTRLTYYPEWDTDPAWSPDGTQIAFVRDFRSKYGYTHPHIYVMNADGSEQVHLTIDQPAGCTFLSPTWSSDGTRIAFSTDCTGGPGGEKDIYVMNIDGSGSIRLAHTGLHFLDPNWSPDSTKIVYVMGNNIWVMNADSSGQTKLTKEYSTHDSDPAWSPDGSNIAFDSGSGPYADDTEIYIMNADGSGLTQLTNNDVYDGMPTWQPLAE